MRAVIQRVAQASVKAEGKEIAKIGPGLAVLLGVGEGDAKSHAESLAKRLLNLRILADRKGKMNRSVLEAGGEILVVPQFTLYADASRGRRPSFSEAARPKEAEKLYESFVGCLKKSGLRVETGKFGAYMVLALENDGPVTLVLET